MSTTYPDVLRGAAAAVATPSTSGRAATPSPPRHPGWARRERGATRGALGALLVLTALGYLWGLGASGYANSFYAAAVQAGTQSWKAFLFGSIDSSNFITVDKPPASLWLMELSGRVFGFSSWSMLIPEALAGVAAVALVHATVRRWFGSPAGLVAGTVMAATPVAALMFRFNNPDALLVALLVASAYTFTRAVEKAGTRWVVATGALLGLAFLTKMLQAFTVLPAMAAVYAIAAPAPLRRRLLQLAAGGAAIAVSAGWWVATVALWPAGSRPMIDGSSDNSIINLILGYNGLGRLYSGSSGAGGGGGNFSGATGVLRLFNDLMGGQASWLIPAALLVVVVGSASRIRAPRTDRTRAALMLWGGWLVVTGAVFSFGQGVIHTYYTVALAPAIAALVGIGVALAWEHRRRLAARLAAAAAVAGSGAWAYVLLDRTPAYHPWLRVVVAVAGAIGAVALAVAGGNGRATRRLGAVAAGAAMVACLAGPVAYAASTVATPHTGSIPSAGPAAAASTGGGGAAPGAGRSGGPTGAPPQSGGTRPSSLGAAPGSSTAGGAPSSTTAGAAPSGGGVGSRGSTTTSSSLTAALRSDAGRYRWVAATLGSQSAASLELASDEPVMAIGGFNGQGGNLTLATFESYVAKGDIHWFIAAGGTGGGGGQASSAITTWVAAHFTAKTIGGQTVYDLSNRTA